LGIVLIEAEIWDAKSSGHISDSKADKLNCPSSSWVRLCMACSLYLKGMLLTCGHPVFFFLDSTCLPFIAHDIYTVIWISEFYNLD
jgi:hypothetical protein